MTVSSSAHLHFRGSPHHGHPSHHPQPIAKPELESQPSALSLRIPELRGFPFAADIATTAGRTLAVEFPSVVTVSGVSSL